MATSQDFVNWICTSALEPKFLLYLLMAEKDGLLRFGRGTTHTTIYFPEVKAFRVCLPPPGEQRRIIEKIEAIRDRSRKAKEQLEATHTLLKSLRDAVLTYAFFDDSSIDMEDSAPAGETGARLLASIRQERRLHWERTHLARMNTPPSSDNWKSKYKSPAPLDDSGLPRLPQTWCWAAAEEVVEPGDDIVYGIVQPGPRVQDGIPYVRGVDIQGGHILLNQLWRTSRRIADRYQRSSLKSGDVLLGIIRATKVAIVPTELAGGNITQGTARFRPSKVILTKFLAHWLESPFAQEWLHRHYRGIDMPGLNLSDVRRLPIPLPPLNVQRAVAERLASRKSQVAAAEKAVVDGTSLVDALDRALLAKAFRGELVAHDPSEASLASILPAAKEELMAMEQNRSTEKKRRIERGPGKEPDVQQELFTWIDQQAPDSFTFDEIRDAVPAPYEALKDAVFDLLEDPKSGVEQYFDKTSQEIQFRKTVQ